MKKIRVYYYNPFLTTETLKILNKGEMPLQSYYGLNYFDNNIEIVIHKLATRHPNNLFNRALRNITNFLSILKSYRKYDLIYVTNARGIKLLAFLRALKIFPKPVCMLIHWAVIVPESKLKRPISKLYIKGFDHLFFFSRELLDISLKTGWIKNSKVVHWGCDLDFYDKRIQHTTHTITTQYLSTGTEKRDFKTLVQSFEQAKMPLTLYLTEKSGNIDYKSAFDKFSYNKSLIDVIFLKAKINLTAIAKTANCIVISLSPFTKNKIYPLGLTSLVEAMTLAKPVIITDNQYNGIDVEKIGCGIKVAYNDINSWINAIKFMSENKEIAVEMGKKGRKFIENSYNLKIFGQELSDYFIKINHSNL
ncbi:MAG: hypothetical protein LBS16_04190 [Prevotellaceae bacterium]|jgi:glycosyltransferase involved in cell wall biosynthesis|nr:hypothetical protein [Prevotellaceae bacterium]